MLKRAGVGERDGEDVQFMILGLTDENVLRLLKGEPIAFKGEELGVPLDVFLVYGINEQAIADQLKREGFPTPMPYPRPAS